MSYNHIGIMGRLTRDIELRTTNSNQPVINFSVAVERNYMPKGADKRPVDFINCTAWGSAAEFIAKYFSKGSMICVHGALESSQWEDDDGNVKTNWAITVSDVYFTGETKREDTPQTKKRYKR